MSLWPETSFVPWSFAVWPSRVSVFPPSSSDGPVLELPVVAPPVLLVAPVLEPPEPLLLLQATRSRSVTRGTSTRNDDRTIEPSYLRDVPVTTDGVPAGFTRPATYTPPDARDRSDPVEGPLRRGRHDRPVHGLYGLHRGLPLPRPRLRERRPGPAPGGRSRRLRARRSRVLAVHACLPSLPRVGGRDRLVPVRPNPQARGGDRAVPGHRPRPRGPAGGSDAGPGRRRGLGAPALGARARRDRRGPLLEALGRASLGRRTDLGHRRRGRARHRGIPVHVLRQSAGAHEGGRARSVEGRPRRDVLPGQRDRVDVRPPGEQVGEEDRVDVRPALLEDVHLRRPDGGDRPAAAGDRPRRPRPGEREGQAPLLHTGRRGAHVLLEEGPRVHSAWVPALPRLRRRARRHLVRRA